MLDFQTLTIPSGSLTDAKLLLEHVRARVVVKLLKVFFYNLQNSSQLLQRSLSDVKSRAEREMESVRQSYAVRLDAIREQTRTHAIQQAESSVVDLDEIKRFACSRD